jgi:type I restriction enzyme, R subunit
VTDMSNVGQVERETQNRVVKLFRERLGYDYLGNWEYREGNSNVEVDLLAANLRERSYDDALINRAVDRLRSEASLGGGRDLYEANQNVYRLLRYGTA